MIIGRVARAYVRNPGWTVFAATWLVYAATASWWKVWNSDVEASVWPAYQLASTGRLWLEGTPFSGVSPFFISAGDHLVSNRQIGIILAAAPFYWVAGSPAAVWPSALAAVSLTAAGVALMHMAIRTLVPAPAAIAATVVMAIGSPTWTVSADGMWSHTVTQFTIAAAAYFAARERWWVSGAALGFGILARPHLAVVALVLGLGMAWSRRDWRIAGAVGIPSAIGAAVLVGLNRAIYGEWTVSGYGSYVSQNLGGLAGLGGLDDGDAVASSVWRVWEWLPHYLVNWLGLLIAPDRGLFVWTPLALLLLPAAWRARKVAPDWVLALAAGGLAYTAVQLRINEFHGVDVFFGYRHALELFTCALPLYAIGWHRTERAWVRGLAAGLLVLQVFAMLFGAFRSAGVLGVFTVWTDNTIVFLVRNAPLQIGPLAVAILASAALFGIRVARHAMHAAMPTGDTTQTR